MLLFLSSSTLSLYIALNFFYSFPRHSPSFYTCSQPPSIILFISLFIRILNSQFSHFSIVLHLIFSIPLFLFYLINLALSLFLLLLLILVSFLLCPILLHHAIA